MRCHRVLNIKHAWFTVVSLNDSAESCGVKAVAALSVAMEQQLNAYTPLNNQCIPALTHAQTQTDGVCLRVEHLEHRDQHKGQGVLDLLSINNDLASSLSGGDERAGRDKD